MGEGPLSIPQATRYCVREDGRAVEFKDSAHGARAAAAEACLLVGTVERSVCCFMHEE